MVRCKHIWLLVEQGSAMFMECESCSAIVAVGWDQIPHGGYAFQFGIPRPGDRRLVTMDDLRELGEWFAQLVNQRVAVTASAGRRVRRSRAGA